MTNVISRLPIVVLSVHSRRKFRCGLCDIWRDDRNRELPVSRLEAQLPDMLRVSVE